MVNTPEERRHLHHSLAYCQHVCSPSPRWQVLRGLVFVRADGWCEVCGEGTATQVHHVTYRNLGDEELLDLLAVCARCHKGLTFTPASPSGGVPGRVSYQGLATIAWHLNRLGWDPREFWGF